MSAPFPLEFYLIIKLALKFKDCNFHGLSRPFKVRANPVYALNASKSSRRPDRSPPLPLIFSS